MANGSSNASDGKLSRLMGDAARGINAFKKGLKDNESGGEVKSETAEAGKEIPAESRERDEAAKG